MSGVTPEQLQAPAPFERLADWQEWVTQEWIYPIGSLDAQLHTRAKLDDEVGELAHALSHGNDEQIKDELGDVLWTATGTAYNAGVSLKECFSYDKEDDKDSVQLVDLERHTASIDRSPLVYDSYEAELMRIKPDYSDPLRQIQVRAHDIGKGAKQYFVWNRDLELNNPPRDFADAWALVKRQRAVEGLRQIFIASGIIAQDRLGITLAEIMEHNRQKLLGRIARGEQITKLPE